MEDCLLAWNMLPLFSFAPLSTALLTVCLEFWLHQPYLQPPCVRLFSISLAHSALLPHASSFSALHRPLQKLKYLSAATWRQAVYCLMLAISLHPFLFIGPHDRDTVLTWSTRVLVMPWLKFSLDGGMEETGWLLFASVCRFGFSVEFADGRRSCSSLNPNLIQQQLFGL